jgi:hypothetical protein
MINTKPLKEQAVKLPEPLKSIIEMSKDSMPEQEFIGLFMGLRKKAREMDVKQKEGKP